MAQPTTPSPSHEQQAKLRETMRLADAKLAAVLQRFEELTGFTVRGVSVARYPTGQYCAQLLIGGAPRQICEPEPAERSGSVPADAHAIA